MGETGNELAGNILKMKKLVLERKKKAQYILI